MPLLAYHYTDKDGFNGVRSAFPDWLFVASEPPPVGHPFGAYFTNLLPSNKQLAKKLRIPAVKTEYCYEFLDSGDLVPLHGNRGEYIFYSPEDYRVRTERQRYNGLRTDWEESAS